MLSIHLFFTKQYYLSITDFTFFFSMKIYEIILSLNKYKQVNKILLAPKIINSYNHGLRRYLVRPWLQPKMYKTQ